MFSRAQQPQQDQTTESTRRDDGNPQVLIISEYLRWPVRDKPLAVISHLICEPPPYACPEAPLRCAAWTSRVLAPKLVAGSRPGQSCSSARGTTQRLVSAWLSRVLCSGRRPPTPLFPPRDPGGLPGRLC